MENELYWNILKGIENRLRSVVFSQNYTLSALRVLFLKYVIDNYIGAKSAEEMQICARAQKMFALRDISSGLDSVMPVLEYIDNAFGMDHILSGPETIDAYRRELFGSDSTRKKRNASEPEFQQLLEYIGRLDLEEKNDIPVGHEIVWAVMLELAPESSYATPRYIAGDYTVTSSPVCSLAKALLKVSDADTYLDFASGISLSTLQICSGARPMVQNAELNRLNAALGAMLLILDGFDKFKLVCGDTIKSVNPELKGNKVFVDSPLEAKIQRTEQNDYSDATLACLNRIKNDYLAENGDAVMPCSGVTLYQSKKQTVDLRRSLVEDGLIKAVIALPMLSAKSVTVSHMLVLQKTAETSPSNIVFIEGSKGSFSHRDRFSAKAGLTEELIADIVECVENRKAIPGFSCVVPVEEIQRAEYNLVPATYLPPQDDEDDISIEEINAQLKGLYELLQQKS